MKYMFLGGAGEVGGSCLLISAAERYILIDCGIRVNQQGTDALPDLAMLKNTVPMLDAIFLSHAHADHVGALPLAHHDFPQAPIYATLPTQRLSSVMLNDAVRVQNTQGETVFTQEAMEATLGQIQILKIGKWNDLWKGWRVKFIRSGHILGAVSILLDTPEGLFFYSGDVSAFRQRTIDGLDDVNGIEPDYMFCEATYGTSNHPSRTSEEMKLAKSVEAVVKNGGSVLIPSFALGRAQEILLILKDAMRSGTIEPFPVFADGLVRNICGVYESLKPHLSQKIQQWLHNSQQPMFFTDTLRTVKHGERDAVLKDKTPKCIIASSGMLTGGASVEYAKAFAPGANNAIFLSGYQDAESPGRRLQTLQQGDDLLFADGSAVEVKCSVDRFHLSAHSDQGQLVNLVKQVNPKAVALVHGEIDAIHALRDKLYKKFPVIYAVNGKVFDGSSNPEWLSPAAKSAMVKNGKLDITGEFTDFGITFDAETLQSQRWRAFRDGTHKWRLEGNRLIISKLPA